MSDRFVALNAFVKARLKREGRYGLQLTIGALFLIGATYLFSLIAHHLSSDQPLALFDVQFSAWLYAHHREALIKVMLVITNLHSMAAISVLTLIFAAYLFRQRQRYWVMVLLLSVFGGMLLNVALKNLFHRTRPHFVDPILTFSSYGFPSGHTMTATCFYGIVAAFALWKFRTWPGVVIAAISLFLVLLVGFSRIYLGAHYLSDVLGAMLEGVAWLALCFAAFDVTGLSHRPQKPEREVS